MCRKGLDLHFCRITIVGNSLFGLHCLGSGMTMSGSGVSRGILPDVLRRLLLSGRDFKSCNFGFGRIAALAEKSVSGLDHCGNP